MNVVAVVVLLATPRAAFGTNCCEGDYAPEGGCTDEYDNVTGLICADSDSGLECITSDDWDASVHCSKCCEAVTDDDFWEYAWSSTSSSSGGVGVAVTLVIVFSLTCFCCVSAYLYRRRQKMPFAPTTVVATEASPMSDARVDEPPESTTDAKLPVATPQVPAAQGVRITDDDPMALGNRVSTSSLLDAAAPDPSSAGGGGDPSASITSAHL